MEVILTQNIKGLGLVGDLVKVAAGYAQNYLIPKGFANIATPTERVAAEQKRQDRVTSAEELAKNTTEYAKKLEGVTLSFTRKVSSGDKVFGGISELDVLEILEKEHKLVLDKSHVHFSAGHPKTLGKHDVDLHLHGGTHVTVQVEITEEE